MGRKTNCTAVSSDKLVRLHTEKRGHVYKRKPQKRNWIFSKSIKKQHIEDQHILNLKSIIRNKIASVCYVEKEMKHLFI